MEVITRNLPQVEFPAINSLLDRFYLSTEAIDDLSGEHQLLLEYVVGISRGKVNLSFSAWKINQNR